MKNGGGAIITSTSAHWSIDFDIGIPMRMEIHDLNDKVLIDFLRPLLLYSSANEGSLELVHVGTYKKSGQVKVWVLNI